MLNILQPEKEATWDEINEMINNLKPHEAVCISFQPEENGSKTEDRTEGAKE